MTPLHHGEAGSEHSVSVLAVPPLLPQDLLDPKLYPASAPAVTCDTTAVDASCLTIRCKGGTPLNYSADIIRGDVTVRALGFPSGSACLRWMGDIYEGAHRCLSRSLQRPCAWQQQLPPLRCCLSRHTKCACQCKCSKVTQACAHLLAKSQVEHALLARDGLGGGVHLSFRGWRNGMSEAVGFSMHCRAFGVMHRPPVCMTLL